MGNFNTKLTKPIQQSCLKGLESQSGNPYLLWNLMKQILKNYIFIINEAKP